LFNQCNSLNIWFLRLSAVYFFQFFLPFSLGVENKSNLLVGSIIYNLLLCSNKYFSTSFILQWYDSQQNTNKTTTMIHEPNWKLWMASHIACNSFVQTKQNIPWECKKRLCVIENSNNKWTRQEYSWTRRDQTLSPIL
jgi:hypothetical protein